MGIGELNGHMIDDVSEVLIVTLVCFGREIGSLEKVTAFDRLRVRTNVILFSLKCTVFETWRQSYWSKIAEKNLPTLILYVPWGRAFFSVQFYTKVQF